VERKEGGARSTLHAPRSTRFLVVAGRDADNPQRAEALKRARYFRVVEAEYTGVTTSSHTNLETRILGVVPIQPDGSAYFEAPVDVPLFLDPLDAGGNRVLMEWSYPHTAVALGTLYPATQMAYAVGRAGETKGCYGCHATQTNAVPDRELMALRHEPVRIVRKSTDLEYRRNEPEAYRTQARINEAAKYRPWLESKDPLRRARACEMLTLIEDGAERDVPGLLRLLQDNSVEVRRAAALALTRLARNANHQVLLQAAQKETDWLVKFHLQTAADCAQGVPEASTDWERISRQEPDSALRARVRKELAKEIPDVLAVRAAGKLKDAEAVPLLVPWLKKHVWEYHAAEAAVALGRIGTPAAVQALWEAVRSEVPIKVVHISRYLQHGPRPEEYALLKGLILAEAKPDLKDVHLLLALLPNTFTEKPRFEDRMRPETQRVLMPRLLLEKAGLRQKTVALLWAALGGKQEKDDPLYQQILKGINLERPFSEHGRPFNVVKEIGPEEAVWLLTCLLDPEADLGTVMKRTELEERVVPLLTSPNHRERIDAAVLLGRTGFGTRTAEALAAEVAKPYAFPEIASIGKGMPDPNFRDKAYLVMALARHVDDVERLRPFADPLRMTRDVRYGLTRGLAFRARADAVPLLKEMATRDPITLVRQQARYALADIEDVCRLAGEPMPDVTLPAEQPLEALYPPRGLTWSDTSFGEFRREMESLPTDVAGLRKYLEKCLAPSHFRNLNNAQATGANRMMTDSVAETRQAFAALTRLAKGDAQSPETVAARQFLVKALDSPYPFVQHLAAVALADCGAVETIPALLRKVEESVKTANVVAHWWCCEALARLRAKEAVPLLARQATAANPPNTFGPEGMATGYAAARALARIVADPKQADVKRLLAGDNLWLRAGALRGLAEAKAPGVDRLLQETLDENNAALIRQEARVGSVP
jgi:HEAT repeat protein